MPTKRKQVMINEEKIETIRNDLKLQLLNQGKIGKHFDDMVEDYIYFVKMKDILQKDISEKGLRYKTMTGNGFNTEKENKSPDTLIKTNNQMLKILQVLDLKEPEELPEVGDGKDDLL